MLIRASICVFFVLFSSKIHTKEFKHYQFLTKIKNLESGFSVQGLIFDPYFNEEKFQLSQLIYNQITKWTQTSFIGKFEILNENQILLHPSNCRIYVKPSLEKRWSLDRIFDCEHLKFSLQLQKKIAFIASNIPSLNEKFYIFPVPNGQKIVISILQKNQISLFWGINLFLVGKSKKVLLKSYSNRKKWFIGEKIGQSFLLSQKNTKTQSFFYVKKFFRSKKNSLSNQ